jgi:hypothetical protein
MSEKELESLWSEQTNSRLQGLDPSEWVRKARKRQSRTWMTIVFVGVLTIVGFSLKIHQLLNDPNYNLGNAGFEILLAVVPCLSVAYSVRLLVRQRRELAALKSDMLSCVDHVLRATRQEISEIKKGFPLVVAIVVVLFALAKWQSIAAGREVLSRELGVILIVVGMVASAAALLYHRTTVFLRPRIDQLENLRRTFDD